MCATVMYVGRCGHCYSVVRSETFLEHLDCPNCGHFLKLHPHQGELGNCPRCKLFKALVEPHASLAELGALCATCLQLLNLPEIICRHCGKRKRIRAPRPSGLCSACDRKLNSFVARCPVCGNDRLLCGWDCEARLKVCTTCADRLRDPIARCAECEKVKRLTNKHPFFGDEGRVCSCCYKHLTTPLAACAQCGRETLLPFPGDPSGRICRHCHNENKGRVSRTKGHEHLGPYPHQGTCAECLDQKLLERSHPHKPGGICSRCRKRLQKQLGECAICHQQRVLVQKHPLDKERRICRGCSAKPAVNPTVLLPPQE